VVVRRVQLPQVSNRSSSTALAERRPLRRC
jgi:hypothetical protein